MDVNEKSITNYESQQPIMPIAEREHKKWLNPDVALENNPYSIESIENRAKQMHSMDSLEDRKISGDFDEQANNVGEVEEDQFAKKKFFSSNRDITRYKRDYYLPDSLTHNGDDKQTFSILNVS